jgi:hypothetical protein
MLRYYAGMAIGSEGYCNVLRSMLIFTALPISQCQLRQKILLGDWTKYACFRKLMNLSACYYTSP